ncbi:MAG: tRNA preQ1(34) S-adenosylmethionine ribosyltransferase-isomerase QueA [Deltaproteobacteria bacterium]|nr:tRNA preQ1(34) S-adenosylmethionine ribosyltransferase-isomerase QueA [Deltaproteobacteria bacterium]
MRLAEFDYYLPKGLIAQFPCERRDKSRLMILSRKDRTIEHKNFSDLTAYLMPGDILILNNTKVIPARLFGKKTTGGAVEVLLIQKSEISQPKPNGAPRTAHPISVSGIEAFGAISQTWSCLISPTRGIKKGSVIVFEHGLKAAIIEKGVDGNWVIELYADIEIDKAIEMTGKMPLPPYIKREKGQDKISEFDKERYQTVFAKEKGAIAAPTAGLHFTDELLKKIKYLGVEIFYITLHTGLGTFKSVKTEDITEHKMESEHYNIDRAVFEAIKKAKMENRRVITVGSTVTRALEAMVNPPIPPLAKGGEGGFGWERPILSGATDLFIYPGYKFNTADAIITNFHLPKSTLIMLTAAFAGRGFIMRAYEEAIRLRYRFFSYGDAMIIL